LIIGITCVIIKNIMRFELDKILTDDILFHMENQDGLFLLDSEKGRVISVDDYDNEERELDLSDDERFINLPEWEPQDGYRLMEKFTIEHKNPVIRTELSGALNRNKGVFRAFKDVLEQYPETEKLWHKFKEENMKEEVLLWYNSLRATWGLSPVSSESEDISSLVLEDFIFRQGREGDSEKAFSLHKICLDELKEKGVREIIENMSAFVFPGDLCIVSESASGDFAGFISGIKESSGFFRVCALEVALEFRSLGLGKTLLSKFLEKTDRSLNVIFDLPAGADYFSRVLLTEEFKLCVQRFVR
jgi:ribosomal protein S18 acetylase RimI-like enzyme